MKKESKLLRIFVREPWKAFTITEINRTYKTKSHHYIPEAMKKFSKTGILKEETRGNTNLYSLNYETDEHIGYLAFIEAAIKEDRADIPLKNIKQVTDGIKSPFYALLVGGSYAEGTQKPASDIDIAIIIPDCEEKKSFETALRRGELILPEIHGLVFTQTEFYEMLINKEYNYGKEIAKKHVIVCGAEAYYKILFEAMRYGFKG
ncbi:MAG: nucleotidyltransferase domain-containing protein [Nanoarchaeota archaeon]|nr:nucleotidyltransferase domain-containing protein [Nanoarchaeota archaeon]